MSTMVACILPAKKEERLNLVLALTKTSKEHIWGCDEK
jgi:hypothetical protein